MSDLPSRLPAALADRHALAEIETTASRRHPDILSPFGPGEATPGGRKLLVLEGEPLRLAVVHGWAAEVKARFGVGRRAGDGSTVRSMADGSR
jgi:hypothetical protein